MQQTCPITGETFQITPADQAFYDKLGVGISKLSPQERQRRRLAWRNERTLYRRECSATGKKMVSIYHADAPFPVYDQHYFWGDKWDALEHGKDFDFNRPFFEQFAELLAVTPRISIINKQGQNSDYCNYSQKNKNCYLTFGAHFNEDLIHVHYATRSRDCVDSFWARDCELCYECIDSTGCYNVRFAQNSHHCNDSSFLKNCIGCNNCFGCVNLQQKQYYFFNQALTKEEYKQKMQAYDMGNAVVIQKAWTDFQKHTGQFPCKYMESRQVDNVTGNYIVESRNCEECYEMSRCEDCARAYICDDTYNCRDVTHMGYDRSELCAEMMGCSATFDCAYLESCWHDTACLYSSLCFHNHDLFGCVSLRNKQYCILNKQYSKEKYLILKDKIIAHMKQTGEWGEFFPVTMSPFAYNETVAQEYFPLSQKEVLARGYRWREPSETIKASKTIPVGRLPNNITDAPDDILNWAILCEESQKPFRIQKSELEFYRKMNVPIPHLHAS